MSNSETNKVAKATKASKQKNNKKATKTVNVNVRLEIKPDGRVVWDVNEVHKLIAKQIVKNPDFANAKCLVKKDPSALSLDGFRKPAKEDNTKQEAEKPDSNEAVSSIEPPDIPIGDKEPQA